MKMRHPNHNYDKVAVVLGANGQIGSYLCDYLLELGYSRVVGVVRRTSVPNRENLQISLTNKNFVVKMADVTDVGSLSRLFQEEITDRDLRYEVYSMVAQSQVAVSFKQPKLTQDITGTGHLNVLETLLYYHNNNYKIRNFTCASSEMFGSQKDISGYQSLDTKFWPNSPYAASKLYMFHLQRIYKESYGMLNTSGILFNTESPRRGEEFVTRKITKWFASYITHFSFQTKLQLGNIEAYRDWTHAKDTVRAIHLINTAARPKDYLVASGETHSIKEFMEACYNCVPQIIEFQIKDKLEDLYEINQEFIRPNDVPYLKGQADIIRTELGWKPTVTFEELVREMLISDYLKQKQQVK